MNEFMSENKWLIIFGVTAIILVFIIYKVGIKSLRKSSLQNNITDTGGMYVNYKYLIHKLMKDLECNITIISESQIILTGKSFSIYISYDLGSTDILFKGSFKEIEDGEKSWYYSFKDSQHEIIIDIKKYLKMYDDELFDF